MSLLEADVFFFTTFGGEALSLAAAQATITEIKDKDVPAYLSLQGSILKDGYNRIAGHLGMPYTRCSGLDCRSFVTFDASAGDPLEMKSLVQQEMIRRGVLWSGFHNICFSHRDEDIEYILNVYSEVLHVLKDAVSEGNVRGYIEGDPVEPVFRKTADFNIKPGR